MEELDKTSVDNVKLEAPSRVRLGTRILKTARLELECHERVEGNSNITLCHQQHKHHCGHGNFD